MREDPAPPADPAPPRVGSLFSGYGGLDLAVEHAFHAQTIWFSEISPVQRVFAHHWPDAPNLGDITTINWDQVPPVDILCGGFPCQDVSTVGKMAGLAPGTRSGLWSHMADAIDHLRPEYVGALLTYVLIGSVLTLLVSATIWAVASHTGNPYTAQKARIGVFVALGTAALAGAGIAWADFLLVIGDRI